MRRLVMVGITAVTLAACGGSDATSPHWIALTLARPGLTIAPGQSVTLGVDVVRLDFAGAVSLSVSGMPSGLTATVEPATLTGDRTSATITFVAGPSVARGDARIDVDAEANGVEWQHTTLALTIRPAI